MTEPAPGLVVRKLADKSEGQRVKSVECPHCQKFIEVGTLDPVLVNPATGQPESWPFAGIKIEDVLPRCSIEMGFVARGKAEGWITIEGEERVLRTAGPPEDPWHGAPPHVFRHAEAIVLHTVDGDLRYRVVQQPDKWPDEKDGDAGFGGDVHWFYVCELEQT